MTDLQWQMLETKLDIIKALLYSLQAEVKKMANVLDGLTAQVAATVGAEQSAIVLIQGLAAAIAALAAKPTVDPVALGALVTQLQTSAGALSAAVVANPTPPAGP